MSTSIQVMELFNIFGETYGKEKAQTIVKNIEEIIDSRKQDLATEADILDLKKEVKEVELKLATEIKEVELKLATEIKEVELKLTSEIKEVELKLAKEIEQAKSSTIKWVVGLIIAQTAAIISVMLIK